MHQPSIPRIVVIIQRKCGTQSCNDFSFAYLVSLLLARAPWLFFCRFGSWSAPSSCFVCFFCPHLLLVRYVFVVVVAFSPILAVFFCFLSHRRRLHRVTHTHTHPHVHHAQHTIGIAHPVLPFISFRFCSSLSFSVPRITVSICSFASLAFC